MPAPPTHPRLRHLDLCPVTGEQGEALIALRDPAGVSDATLVVSRAALAILRHFDGRHDARDIQGALLADGAGVVPVARLEGIIQTLDEALFLDSERFVAARAAQRAEYAALADRPAALAGASYPADRHELLDALDGFWVDPAGPGGPPGPPAAPDGAPPLKGLIVPHIDFHRGGPAYAHGYRALAERAGAARLFVVFGTAHQGCEGLFGLTRKGYDTPLGLMPCDADLVDAIAGRCDGQEWFAGDYAHRQEHSIEFQAVWLRRIFPPHLPGGADVRIVPILCGSFHEWVARGGGATPAGSPRVEAMVEAVVGALADRGEPAVVVAGADLAHIGPRFGDPAPPTDAELRRLADEDAQSLQRCVEGDADAFFRHVAADGDARRICGLSPIYMTLRTAGAARGELLQYGQAEDPTGPSTVSFASVALA